ncbi:MAG: hypothetical protein Q8865_04905 [Bacillota bacterium]|nr:hypothetical protein [Bacillota bacterium]
MKKVCSVILASFLIILMAASVSAQDKTVEIPELYMSIPVPDDWYVFKKGFDLNDPAYSDLKVDPAELKKKMKQDFYAVCLSKDKKTELDVSMKKDKHFSTVEFLLDQDDFVKRLKKETKKAGGQLLDYNEHVSGDITYSVTDITLPESGKTTFVRQYMTGINGQKITFTFHSNPGNMENEMIAQCDGIVDSVSFSKAEINEYKKPINYTELLTVVICTVLVELIIKFLRKHREKKEEAQIRPVDTKMWDSGMKDLDGLLAEGVITRKEYRERVEELRDKVQK